MKNEKEGKKCFSLFPQTPGDNSGAVNIKRHMVEKYHVNITWWWGGGWESSLNGFKVEF